MRGLALLPACGVLLVTGCAKKPASNAKAGTKSGTEKTSGKEPKQEETVNVVTTAGTADKRDPVKNVKLYTISWKGAGLTLGRTGIQEGKMNGVSGTVYEAEKPKSTFTAETGYAKKETQTLFLEGKVIVKSPAYSATLRARKLEWLPDVKRYRATGDVTLSTPNGISGPMPELLATADLKRFGTPDTFDKR